MPETSALGAAIAAGVAQGIDVWSLSNENMETTTDVFTPKMSENGNIGFNWYIAKKEIC